ncbi:MAG TPA: SIR2 family protein, partial [Myxococcales bacterium]
MGRTVWVLGAGFSKPLGGPLLGDLLLPESLDNLRATYGERFGKLFDVYATTAHRLYNHGIRFERGHVQRDDGVGQRLWYDPEEFLEIIDLAATKPDSRAFRRIEPIVRSMLFDYGSQPEASAIARVAAAARRLLAAESNAFTQNIDLDAEKYWPYKRWLRDLVTENDAIITFNYDCFLELLNIAVPGSKLQILPRYASSDSTFVRVFKLHGSVDWKDEGQCITPTSNPYHALDCIDSEIAIGSPGPTKQAKMAKLEELWAGAQNAILAPETDCIVFIGYRFPPSDANAKHWLLTALAQSQSEAFAVHIVLGPGRRDDIERLEGMLGCMLHSRVELPQQRA